MTAEEIEKKIEDEFCDVGIDIEGDLAILEKLRIICTTYNLEPEELVAKWFTYSASKNDQDLKLDIIEDFSKNVSQTVSNARKGRKSVNTPQQAVYDIDAIQTIIHEQEEEEDMLQGYAKTPNVKANGKRLHTTPEQLTNKRIANLTRTPAAKLLSPAFSPAPVATPSPKYEARKNKGSILVSFPETSDTTHKWQGKKTSLKVRPFNDNCDLKKPYKFMFQKISEKAEVLEEMITALSESMKDAFTLEDSANILYPDQGTVTVSGRICCDAVGRLNSKSVLLEGSRKTCNGKRVQFDVNNASPFSLFPGQIVSAKGINSTNRFIVQNIYDGVRQPFYNTYEKKEINEDHFVVYVTCGPYATSETLSHAPLTDFLKIVEEERPDLVIMIGPFVDSKQPLIEKAEVDFIYEDKFTEYRSMIMTTALSSGSKVVFVPSQRDVFHDFVYPQPPFEMPEKLSENIRKQIINVSDPSTILVNDVVFGLTSTDILLHLGAEEVSSFAPGSSDRLARLAGHTLKQQSYYPLQPPVEDVNIHYSHFEQFCSMQVSPDVVLLPSDLRFFVKDIDSCLCVNPGRLVKGDTGGTFAKILVRPTKIPNTDKSVVTKSLAQIVKI